MCFQSTSTHRQLPYIKYRVFWITVAYAQRNSLLCGQKFKCKLCKRVRRVCDCAIVCIPPRNGAIAVETRDDKKKLNWRNYNKRIVCVGPFDDGETEECNAVVMKSLSESFTSVHRKAIRHWQGDTAWAMSNEQWACQTPAIQLNIYRLYPSSVAVAQAAFVMSFFFFFVFPEEFVYINSECLWIV